jgi:hypothetical protein
MGKRKGLDSGKEEGMRESKALGSVMKELEKERDWVVRGMNGRKEGIGGRG